MARRSARPRNDARPRADGIAPTQQPPLVLVVEGFKSLVERQEVPIFPLTLLAGANSSGKSSLMQPFLLTKQTVESPSDPGGLRLDGPNVRFTDIDQILPIGRRAVH